MRLWPLLRARGLNIQLNPGVPLRSPQKALFGRPASQGWLNSIFPKDPFAG